MELREKLLHELRDLFERMDQDGSGTISYDEIHDYLDHPKVESYFKALSLDASDMARLFGLLDADGSGEINVEEFLDGCLRLKGNARSIDLHSLICDVRKLGERFAVVEETFCKDQ